MRTPRRTLAPSPVCCRQCSPTIPTALPHHHVPFRDSVKSRTPVIDPRPRPSPVAPSAPMRLPAHTSCHTHTTTHTICVACPTIATPHTHHAIHRIVCICYACGLPAAHPEASSPVCSSESAIHHALDHASPHMRQPIATNNQALTLVVQWTIKTGTRYIHCSAVGPEMPAPT